MTNDVESDGDVQTVSRDEVRIKRPRRYQVLMLNDDYSTMDFVVRVLETVFKKTPAQAVQIMLHVHNRGKGVCGVFTKEIAEAKVAIVHRLAEENGHPLRCAIEPE